MDGRLLAEEPTHCVHVERQFKLNQEGHVGRLGLFLVSRLKVVLKGELHVHRLWLNASGQTTHQRFNRFEKRSVVEKREKLV